MSACCGPSRPGPGGTGFGHRAGNSEAGAEPGNTRVSARAPDRSQVETAEIAGGVFRMGSADPWAYPDDGEGPVHEVQLSPFCIDTTAVSNARFAEFVTATGYVTDAERYGWSFVFGGLLPDDFPETRRGRERAVVAAGLRG